MWELVMVILSLCSVIGALIGKQEGRNIEVMNSFELLSHTVDDRAHIDKEYYYTKEEQCKFSGWCGVGTSGLFVMCFVLHGYVLFLLFSNKLVETLGGQ